MKGGINALGVRGSGAGGVRDPRGPRAARAEAEGSSTSPGLQLPRPAGKGV